LNSHWLAKNTNISRRSWRMILLIVEAIKARGLR
jgi:hypothetical protein